MRDSSIRLRTWVSVGIILFVMLTDQVIKFRVKTGMLLHESYKVTDWFQICFTENKGMAFGMEFVGQCFSQFSGFSPLCFSASCCRVSSGGAIRWDLSYACR